LARTENSDKKYKCSVNKERHLNLQVIRKLQIQMRPLLFTHQISQEMENIQWWRGVRR